ncbi:hypothetical protein TAMA11512_19430 [Selenomonas sp. TAMA-11512]|nr:hypothetical protein TAMA11512_19430 [Selenomonas sp. TAMA-11512]
MDFARGPIAEYVDQLIETAVEYRASDIHVEPFQGKLRVRFRIDGRLEMLRESLDLAVHPYLMGRLKVMAKIDTVERHTAQDGRIRFTRQNGEQLDIRLAILPLLDGEKAVLRLLRRTDELLDVEKLDFSEENKSRFLKLCHQKAGLILLAGPVNSGKTTTLYAALHEINTSDRNIMTIEDPPEYRLEGINQIPVNKKAGMTYAVALKALLRADIDAICLGEIRDIETAEIAVRAALTGHLLFSTVHTEDSLGAVYRLLDMGIPPYLVSASLRGILAQRLVRRLCPMCKEQDFRGLPPVLSRGEAPRAVFYRAKGCTACNGTGYIGRLALHELLVIDEEIAIAIAERIRLDALRTLARQKGLKVLAEDGMEKVYQGVTSADEILQALYGGDANG